MTRKREPASGPLAAWLQAGGSLSARLHQIQPPLTVELLHQGVTRTTAHERAVLGEAVAHGRWVLLRGAGAPMVWARSACTLSAARGPWRAIAGLGTRPLADLLFARSDVRRSQLQAHWLPARHPQARAVSAAWVQAGSQDTVRGVWRRHSVFWRQSQPLIVSEYFVPATVAVWGRGVGCGTWRGHAERMR